MTSIVQHRGPNDHGFLGYSRATGRARFAREADELMSAGESFDVLLGHRRLSILDLSENGRCPMPSADLRLWITYNGEIYNYIELRSQLAALGHRFTTGTDTEVILAAYRQWGTACLSRLNGMWSFALLDLDKKIMFCARDRLGVKPFYYHWDGRTFSFGSEIKQLLTLPRVTREAHAGVLFDFLVFNTYGCNSEETFYRDVRDMRGGHFLVVPLDDLEGWEPRPTRWWNIDLRQKNEGWTDRKYAERYRELFEDAVRLRLRSDVPIGTCLSGGLDSSGIVCMVDLLLKKAGVHGLQKTFTSVSDNPQFDERDYAQLVIDATRVDPSFVNPSPERLLQDLDRLFWHQEEPFPSTSIFAGWCVYGLARSQGVTVTLDGQGPDEMMGGYVPTMYSAFLSESLRAFRLGDLWNETRDIHRVAGISYSRIMRDLAREAASGLVPPQRMPAMSRAREMLSPEFLEQGRADSVVLRRLAALPAWREEAGGTLFDQKLYLATFNDSLPGILRQVDRNSMAFSIEARLPFLDYRLVEYTFALPVEQKFHSGLAKQVYRRALSGVIPDGIRDRRSKLGFVTAESDWVRTVARTAFADTFAGIAADSPYRRDYAQDVLAKALEGQGPADPLLWKIFNLERLRRNGDFVQNASNKSFPAGSVATAMPSSERKLRICVISPGVVHAVPRTIAIAPHFAELHFIDTRGNGDRPTLERGGVHYHFAGKAGRWPIASINLQLLLRRLRPDVICCHYGLGDHFFHAIAYNGCPVGVIAMGTDVLHGEGDVHLSPMVRLLSRMGLRRAGAVSAKSRYLADALDRIGVQAREINYWGANLGRFQPGDRAAARTRLGLPTDVPIVLSARALEPRLNIHLIVEAFPGVLARWPNALLVIIGRSSPEYRAVVTQAIERLGIGASVRLHDEMPQDVLPDYYRASNLTVSVASSDGFPNTLLEVMACEIPMVVGDIPQIRELLVHDSNAVICPISASGIEAAMVGLLGDPARAERLARAGSSTAHNSGDIDANGRRWAGILGALATTSKRPGFLSIQRYRVTLLAYQAARLLHIER